MGCNQSTAASVAGKKKRHNLANNMIVEFSEDVKDSYTIIKQIGEGSISNIYLVKRKIDAGENGETTHLANTLYALKEIDMELVKPGFLDEMRNEIRLMKLIDHPNVLKCYEVYDTKRDGHEKISIVMEYCSGGDLGTHAPYSEKRSKEIVAKLCEAMNYLHKKGIMHRDLKFENIMFESASENAEPKIIDFGLAQKYRKNEHYHDKVGTVYTMSPEAIRGDYDFHTDMWSIGVVAYMLLVGEQPFDGETRKDIAKKVVKGSYSMEGPKWKTISKDAKDFIRHCLQIEPSLRYTAEKALKSAWLKEITGQRATNLRGSTRALLNQLTSNAGSDHSTEFKKIVLNTIAHKATSSEIMDLREVFHVLDTNHDGTLTLDEIRKGIVDTGIADGAAIAEWFERVDVDAGGELSYTEFIAALLETHGELHEDKLAEAFQALDKDHSGFITRSNLKDALGVSMDDEYLEKLLHDADINGDGKISYDEFKAAINETTSSLKSSL